MSNRNSLRWFLYFLLICLFGQTSNAEKTLFSIDSHSSPVAVRAYEIEGNIIKDPVTISEDLFGYGPVGIAASKDLGLDLGISSCYNKVISSKMLGAKEILENERNES